MGAGRPSLYDQSYCERVMELARDGLSVVEMAAEIGVSRNTLETSWPAAHPEFLEAMDAARNISQAWWERQGRLHLVSEAGGPSINASLYSRSMSARFPNDWREKTAQDITSGGERLSVGIIRFADLPEE